MKIISMLFLIFTLAVSSAKALGEDDIYHGPPRWDAFRGYMIEKNEADDILGMSYMISGAIATIGGFAGYYNSSDSLSRGIYAVAQSVGVAAIGYGANVYWIGNDYNSFYYTVEGSSLAPGQRAELLQRFLERQNYQRQRATWIKIATHSLLAIANFYSASHESDATVKGVLNFLGGTNAVIAFSYAY